MKNFGIFLTVFALYFLGFDADAILTPVGGGAGSGTVTSVNIADDSTTPIFTPSGGPVTVSGVLAFTLKNQNAGSVLLGPASGGPAQPTFGPLTGSYLSAIQTLDNVVYLSGNGNDATCIQNSIFLPCQTLQQAMNISSVNPNVVNLIQATDCNVYSGDGLNWFPDVIFQGAGQFCTVIDFGNSGLTMDPSWANGGNFVGGIIATQLISSGTVPALTFDFSGISVGGNDLFLLQDVYANTNIDSNFLAINTGNQQGFLLQNYTQNKGNFDFTDVNFAFLVNSVNQNSGLNITTTGANNCGVTMESSLLNGTVNITGNASGGYGALFVYGGFVNGTININNSNSYLLPTVGSVPPLSSIVSNGNIFFQSDVTSIPYSAANPGQWTGFGVTYPNPALAGQNQISVQNALDGIANYVANLTAYTVPYTPANPVEWNGYAGPGNVGQALDNIASSLIVQGYFNNYVMATPDLVNGVASLRQLTSNDLVSVFTAGNTVYVNAGGNDATCIFGNSFLPCATLAGAIAVNPGFGNIIVTDGGNYSLDGVNFPPGTNIVASLLYQPSIDFGINGPIFTAGWGSSSNQFAYITGFNISDNENPITLDLGTPSAGNANINLSFNFCNMNLANLLTFEGTNNPGNVNFNVNNGKQIGSSLFLDSNGLITSYSFANPVTLQSTTLASYTSFVSTTSFNQGVSILGNSAGGNENVIAGASFMSALIIDQASASLSAGVGTLPALSGITQTNGANIFPDGQIWQVTVQALGNTPLATNDGALAMTSTHILCTYNVLVTNWVQVSDGATLCVF